MEEDFKKRLLIGELLMIFGEILIFFGILLLFTPYFRYNIFFTSLMMIGLLLCWAGYGFRNTKLKWYWILIFLLTTFVIIFLITIFLFFYARSQYYSKLLIFSNLSLHKIKKS